jgi:serine protease Do
MRNFWWAALCAAGLVVVASGAGTEARAQYSRRTPIVEAVQKTRAAIVTVKVDKPGRTRETIGTGVIVDERGYVVTNRHVVHEGIRVLVRLANGSDLRARMLASDPRRDLAVLRVRAGKTLPALLLAPASDVMVGETVIAVGHPFGYRNTVSTGIVSAVGRELEMPTGDVLSGLIQTDASINPGNSGGPLLNINGELIGINAALPEGAHGIAFAISSDTVKSVLSRHLSALRVAGVRHGLACRENVAPEGKRRQHVVLHEVAEGTPAAAAGLRSGDEIVRVGRHDVTNRFDVERALWDSRPGQTVEVKVVREGKTLTVALKLGRIKGLHKVATRRRQK